VKEKYASLEKLFYKGGRSKKPAKTTPAAITSSSFADGVDPALEMTVLLGGIPNWNDFVQGENQGGGIFSYNGEYEDPQIPSQWNIGYEAVYNTGVAGSGQASDVFLTFGLTNNTGGPEVFTVIADLPLLQTLLNPTVSGDVEGSLADSNFDGFSLLADDGTPIYQGSLDGVVQLSLMTNPFSFSAPAFGSAPFGPFAGGGPGVPGSYDTSIKIAITFELSDGDSVSFTANFSAKSTPAPGALALIGLAGLVGGRRRRR
jgi:MYXO-CTERM domain-containing protein